LQLDRAAQLFLQYNYPETKDLAKHFLTVVASILVFSLAFSEKILGFARATRWTRGLLVAAWCSMLQSIVACGLGLVANSVAGGRAVYGGDFRTLATASYLLIILAGATLILGLLALTGAGALALYQPTASAHESSAT